MATHGVGPVDNYVDNYLRLLKNFPIYRRVVLTMSDVGDRL